MADPARYCGVVRRYLQQGLYDRVLALIPLVSRGRRFGSPMRLEFGYFDDHRFGASSTQVNGVDLIGIRAGTVVRLATVLHAMLSHPDLLPGLYYLGCEGGSVTLFEGDLTDGEVDMSAELALPGLAATELEILLTLSENFIFRHELAHISHGHLDWYNARTGIFHVASDPETKGIAPIDRQTLEWDADCDAISVTLQSAIDARVVVLNGRRVWDFPAYGPKGPFLQQLQRACTAMHVAMRFSGTKLPDLPMAELLKGTYPPASFRLATIATLVIHILHLRTGIALEQIVEQVTWAIQQAEIAWARVFSTEPANLHDEHVREIGAQLNDHFEERWRVLRPELDPCKRWGILAQ